MSVSPGQLARKRFFRNKPAVLGALIILIGIVIAIFAYLFTPDATTNANTQIVELKLAGPGQQATLLKTPLSNQAPETSFWELIWKGKPQHFTYTPILNYRIEGGSIRFEHFTGDQDKGIWNSKPLAAILYPDADVISLAEAQTIIRTKNGEQQLSNAKMAQQIKKDNIVTKTFLLGTDALGRDYLSRILLGARVSLAVGLMAVVISLIIGLLLGSVAGYFRGWIDEGIMYFINVFWSIPTLLLALSLSLVFTKGLWQVFMAIGLTMWIEVARIVRGQFISLRELEYVEAAKSLGFGNIRTIFRHMLPNIIGPVIVIMASNFSAAILLEAGLSFLGLGVDRPTPSWGMMLSDNRTFLVAGRIHLAILPGIAISLFVLSFFLIGNGLRDAFDVKSKSRH